MLPVFICKYEKVHREQVEAIVKKYTASQEYRLELALSCGSPIELMNYIETCQPQRALYFLDVNFHQEINGFVLARKIRERDVFGTIVFITSHIELSHLTFQYKIEAMDYIIRSSPAGIVKRVQECIEIAYRRSVDNGLAKKSFQVKVGSEIRNIPLQEIMFFASHDTPHKLRVHTEDRFLEFYGSFKNIDGISPDFFRCHKSFLVNVKNVKTINKANRMLEMANGEVAYVTVKKMAELQRRLAAS